MSKEFNSLSLVEQVTAKLSSHVNELKTAVPHMGVTTLPEEMTVDTLMAHLRIQSVKKEIKGEHKEFQTELPQPVDAISMIEQFLQQKENVLLLLGERGAGKNLLTWRVTQHLLAGKPSWLPLPIELDKLSQGDLTDLLDHQLANYGFNEESIAQLKQGDFDQTAEPKLLVILDAYEALQEEAAKSPRDRANLFKRIGGSSWKPNRLKVIVTCRRAYLPDISQERLIFGTGPSQHYQRLELLPLTVEQVAQILKARFPEDAGAAALARIDPIKTLLTNPLLLSLFLKSPLAGMKQELTQLTRYDIYTAYFYQWIAQEVQALSVEQKATAGRNSPTALIKECKQIAYYLALCLYANKTRAIALKPSSQASNEQLVWSLLSKQVKESAERDYDEVWGLYDMYNVGDGEKPDKEAVLAEAEARAKRLVNWLMPNIIGSAQTFAHSSFYEYLVTAAITHLAESNDHYAEAAMLALFKQRLIQTEPGVVDFMRELSSQAHPMYAKCRLKWFEWVQRSRSEPGFIGAVSSNAATLLVACHEPLIGQSWSKVQLAGADLRNGVFAHSDLRDVNFRGAQLGQSCCYETNFTGSDCRHVDWGDHSWLQLDFHPHPVAHHTAQPQFAMVQDNEVRLVHRTTGQLIGLPLTGHTGPINGLAFSSGNTLLASASSDHTVRIWDVLQHTPTAVLEGHSAPVNDVAFSHKNGLASAGSDHTVRLWDVAKRSESAVLTGHESKVLCVTFSLEGDTLASADEEGVIWLWDVLQKKPLSALPLSGHTNRVTALAFSPKKPLLVSASADGTARLWDIEKMTCGAPLSEHKDAVTSVDFNLDGSYLATGGADNTVRVWAVSDFSVRCVAVLNWYRPIHQVAFISRRLELVSSSSTSSQSSSSPTATRTAHDILAITDRSGTVSFWTVSLKEGQLQLMGMPKQSSMQLFMHGAQWRKAQVNAAAIPVLKQAGAEVGQAAVVKEALLTSGSKLESKSSSTLFPSPTSSPRSSPRGAHSPGSSPRSGGFGLFAKLFSGQSPKNNPASPVPKPKSPTAHSSETPGAQTLSTTQGNLPSAGVPYLKIPDKGFS